MKKLSEKGRRVLRKIYSGLGAVVLSFLFPGCFSFIGAVYGPPPGPPPNEREECEALAESPLIVEPEEVDAE